MDKNRKKRPEQKHDLKNNIVIPQRKYIAVLAGHFREFQHFIDNEIKPSEKFKENLVYLYIDSPHKVRGIEISDIKIVGTFWDRSDAGKLNDYVKERLNLYNWGKKKTKTYSVPVHSHVTAHYIVQATSKDEANKIVEKEMEASMKRQLAGAPKHPHLKKLDGWTETYKSSIKIL